MVPQDTSAEPHAPQLVQEVALEAFRGPPWSKHVAAGCGPERTPRAAGWPVRRALTR